MVKFYQSRFFLAVFTLILLSCTQVLAQQLPQINYQGVARKADGSPIMEQSISLRLTIRDGGATGANVYSETRQQTTNKFGLFNVVIGSTGALSQSGTMSAVKWSTGNKFLQVEIDPAGGGSFINMGTSQLQSVPYAIFASSAAPGGTAGGDLDGTYPNPTVSKLQGKPISTDIPVNGQVLKWNGTFWIPSDVAATIGKADAATDGYLSKTDWLIFNGKASVTYVDAAITANSNALIAEKDRATSAESILTSNLSSRETVSNKTTDILGNANSDTKYPSVKAVKTYIDAISGGGSEGLTTEVNRAKAAEGILTTALTTEVTRAMTAEGILTANAGLKMNISDTTAMLSPYAKKAVTQSALDLKAPLVSPTFTGTVSGITKAMVGLENADNTSDLNKPVSSATQSSLDLKVNLADTAAMLSPYAKQAVSQSAIALKVNIADTAAMLSPYAKQAVSQSAIALKVNISDTTAMLSPYAKKAATQSALDLKAPLASPTFTGTVSGITKAMVGLENADNTSDLNKPVSSAAQSAIALKVNLADTAAMLSPYAKQAVSQSAIALKVNIADTTAMLSPYAKKAATQSALDLKAPLASPTFTGTVSGITKAMVGLENADNTSDVNKPVSSAAQSLLDLKVNLADTAAMLSPYAKKAATQSALDLKAPLASPTFTGTVSGITKAMVGLENADNTSDLNKPVSSAAQSAIALKVNLADTAAMLSPYAKQAVSQSAIALKVNIADTTAMLSPYAKKAATQSALDLKAPLASPTFTGTVSGITKTMVGLENADNTSDLNKPVSSAAQSLLDLKVNIADTAAMLSPYAKQAVSQLAIALKVNIADTTAMLSPYAKKAATQSALDLKAPLASPTFTGTVSGITKTMVGLENADNTSDINKPVSSAAQLAIALKVNLADTAAMLSPYAKQAVSQSAIALKVNIADTTAMLIPYAKKAATQSALDLKAPLASPTFTGNVSGITKAMVGLENADNTSDVNKPVSSAMQSAIALKVNLADTAAMLSPYAKQAVSQSAIALKVNIADTTAMLSPYAKKAATQSALDLKAPLASPTFTGTVSGITKAMVGLENTDNTSDVNKPVSSATQSALNLKVNLADTAAMLSPYAKQAVSQSAIALKVNLADTTAMLSPYAKKAATQSALDLKAPLASPTFTGTVSGITKTMVGLENADNTSDINKPVSSAAQSAIALKVNIADTAAMLSPYAKRATTQSALDLKAPLASPTFTGNVILPASTVGVTQTAADNSTKLATTAYADATATTASSGKQVTLTNSAGLANALNDETGTGLAVFSTSPNLITPTLGAATATTVNKLTLTTPASSATLTISDGKTLTVNNNATVSGTNTGDQTAATVTNTAAGNIVATTVQAAINELDTKKAPMASPTFTGTVTLPAGAVGVTQTAADNSTKLATTAYADAAASTASSGKQVTLTNSAGLANALSDETGTGLAVFATSPTLTTPALGAATATTVNKLTITAPTSSATLTIANSKTLTVNSSVILSGTDGKTLSLAGDLTTTGAYTTTFAAGANTTLTLPTTPGTLALTSGNITGNASTVTTNANLTGPVTSVGNATAIANGAITNAMLANGAVANLSGTNTGDNAANSSTTYIGTTALALNRTSASQALTGITSIDGTAANVSGTVLGTNGGTGVNNGTKTITLGGNLTTIGAYATTLTSTNVTSVTLPTTGTLATLTGSETLTNKTLTAPVISTITNTGTLTLPTVTGTLALTSSSITGNAATATSATTATNIAAGALGSIPYQSAAGNTAFLPGSNTGSLQFLSETGTGIGNGTAAPVWKEIFATDVKRTNTDGYGANVDAAIAKLAPLASPTFTGTVTLPTGAVGVTQTAGDNSTKLATTAYADAATSTAVSSKQGVLTNSLGLANALSDETGTGLAVFATSPTLTTPTLGAATATTVNKLTITAPSTSATLTIANGKILTVNNTLIFTGTDASTLNIGGGGTLGTNAYTSTVFAPSASPTFTGTVTLPATSVGSTPAAGDNSTQLATTAFVYASIREVADEFTATSGSTSFTLSQTKAINSKVKMYINGIRISNTAYTLSGTTLTYNPANNGSYTLVAGDRIQFDYYY